MDKKWNVERQKPGRNKKNECFAYIFYQEKSEIQKSEFLVLVVGLSP